MSAGGGFTSSSPQTVSPFGQQPFRLSNLLGREFASPLARGLGFRSAGDKFQAQLARGLEGNQPLANLIASVREQVPGALSRSQEIGTDIASRAPALFDSLQGQVDQFLQNLPNFQAAAGRGVEGVEKARGLAEQRASDVSSPGRASALFQQFADPALDIASQRAAARGIAGTGAAQGEEEGLLQNLTRQFIMDQGAQQDVAAQNLAGISQGIAPLLGLQTGLGQAGIGAAQQQLGALPALGQLLSQEFNLPLSTAGNVLSMLQGAQNPAMQLLQLVSPEVGQSSFGFQQEAGLK
jgi:hypothetical protein